MIKMIYCCRSLKEDSKKEELVVEDHESEEIFDLKVLENTEIESQTPTGDFFYLNQIFAIMNSNFSQTKTIFRGKRETNL